MTPLCYRYYADHAERQHKVTTAPDVLYPSDPRRPINHYEVTSDTAGRERVWLLLHHEQDRPDELAVLQPTLGERFHAQEKRAFPGNILIAVVLYVRTTP